MKNKLWLVVAREYKTNVQKKSFWIGLLLGPAFFAAVTAIQILSATVSPDVEKKVAIVDHSGQLAPTISEVLSENKFKTGKQEYQVEIIPPSSDSTAQNKTLNNRVGSDDLFGYLTVGDSLEAKGAYKFYTRNVGNEGAIDQVRDALDKALVGVRLKSRNINLTRTELDDITKAPRISTFEVNQKGEAKRKSILGSIVAVFAFILTMIMPIIAYGIGALRSILEEKSSRVIEVLLSSVTPFQLMMGKIIGACAVGLTQVAVYVAAGSIASMYGLAGAPPGIARDIMAGFSPVFLIYFMIYFLLAFFLFVSLFAAVGSMVNSEQEAQHMQTPVMFSLIIPVYATMFFLQHPESSLARILSFVPIFTPTIMMTRIVVQTPPMMEIVATMVWMFVVTLGVVWVVSKIFRVGILMYGKKPDLPEIIRWVKAG